MATLDIAAAAAKHLSSLEFKGNSVEFVLGQRDITYNEMTTIIGRTIGLPDLKYVTFSYDDGAKAMVQTGYFSADTANKMVELAKAMNEGTAFSATKRTPENTTKTSFEEFVNVFAHIYKNS